MALTVQSICKNTFISFVAELESNGDMIPASLMSPSRRAPRSRSADCVRCREEADLLQERAKQSLRRLDVVLSVGISTPDTKVIDAHQVSAKTEFPETSELKMLQAKLEQALATSSPPQSPLQSTKKPCSKRMRRPSNCSVSTMASEDASDVASIPSTSPRMDGMRRMSHARSSSSGSVRTMVSDPDFVHENEEVEFELDIEAGAEAARSEGAEASLQAEKPARPARWSDIVDAEEATFPEDKCMSSTASRRQVTAKMNHGQVPKKQNMEEMFSSGNEPITTMMIRNIPGRYSQEDLMMDLKNLGFEATYDFLYMPMDKGTSTNVGYGFVNFVHPFWAQKCLQSFQAFAFKRHQRSTNKWAKVSVAHLQGLQKNMRHYESAAVNVCSEKRGRPMVFANISKMF